MSEKTAHFGARARVVDLLGREQIADAATAVSELLKNSVDALASKAEVRFDTKHNCLQVEDDGLGMRTSDLLDKWLILATESKHKTEGAESATAEYRRFADPARVALADKYPPLGEKGIGRLAVAILGRGVLVWTRWGKGAAAQRTLLFIHWAMFEHPRLSLNDIVVPYAELHDRAATVDDALTLFASIEAWVLNNESYWQSETERAIRDTILSDVQENFFSYLGGDIAFSPQMGTLFCILGTKEDVPSFFEEPKLGEESLGNETDALRLLLGFCDPFDVCEKRLDVQFEIDRKIPNAERNFWREEDFAKVDHYIDITLDAEGAVRGKVRRFKEVFDYSYQIAQLPNAARYPGPVRLRLGYVEGEPENSQMPPDLKKSYEDRLRAFSSIYVYRDGIRVLPYGRRDLDLFRFEDRRLKNAGLYFFAQRRMFGGLYISAQGNPRLRDKAGREGFVYNPSQRGLVFAFSDVFIDLAKTYFGRQADRPDKEERKRKKEATNAEAARARIKKATVAFKRDLTQWKRSLPGVIKTTDAQLAQAQSQIATAVNGDLKVGDAGKIILSCESALDKARKFIKEAEDKLGTEVPNIVALSKTDSETFDGYLSERERWQHAAIRKLSQLSAEYEGLAANYRSEQERLEAVQARIDRNQTACFNLLDSAQFQLVAAINTILKEQIPLWRAQQTQQLNQIVVEAVGDSPAAQVIAEQSKAAFLEAALGRQLQQVRELYLPFWLTLTEQMNHLDQAEAGEIALGELNRRLEVALERERDFAELAQLGLIVESLDHDYKVMFHDVGENLEYLREQFSNEKDAREQIDRLQKGFESLVLKLGLLSPLYRQREIGPTDVTGASVLSFIEGLYPPAKREDLTFSHSPRFTNQTLHQVNAAAVKAAAANLVGNAFHWTAQSAAPREIRFTSTKGGFIVSDSGPGVSPRDAERIFEPFFGRRPYGRGLGLYIARTNLEASGMEIFLAPEPQPRALSGANFIIRKRFIEDTEVEESE